MLQRSTSHWTERHVNQSKDGLEYYHYPSLLAQQCWYYVQSIGQARVERDYRYRLSDVPGYLLHFVRAGRLQQCIRNQRFDVDAGSVALMDRSVRTETINCGDRPVEVWWVAFNGKDMPHLFTELRADRMPVFSLEDSQQFAEHFQRLIDLIRLKPVGHEAKAFAALAAMLAELYASRQTIAGLTQLVGDKVVLSDAVRTAMDYVTRYHAESTLTLERIREAAGVSVRHLNRLFTSELNMTPMRYLRQFRIERARELLAYTDKSVEEVASLVGIPNQSHFTYIFRRMTGQPPRSWCRSQQRT